MDKKYEELIDSFQIQIKSLQLYVESVHDLLKKEYKTFFENQFTSDKKSLSSKIYPTLQLLDVIRNQPEKIESIIKEYNEKSGYTGDVIGLDRILEIFSIPKLGVLYFINDGDKIDVKIDNPYIERVYKEEKKKIDVEEEKLTLLYRTSLITLCNIYETTIAKLLRMNIAKKPSLINLDKKTITFDELTMKENLEQIKDDLIDEGLTEILRKSNKTWIDFLAKNIEKSLFIKIEEQEIENINEMFQRRNMIVHNNGIVSEQYLKNTNFKFAKKIKKGRSLSVSKEYIDKKIELIEFVILKIIYFIWKNDSEADILKAIDFTGDLAYTFLNNEKYENSSTLYELLLEENLNQRDRLLYSINNLQTYKWRKQTEKIESEIKKLDFSLAEPTHLMCRSLLVDDFDGALKNLMKLIKDNPEDINDYIDWPILKELIHNKKFEKFIEENGLKEYVSNKEDETVEDNLLVWNNKKELGIYRKKKNNKIRKKERRIKYGTSKRNSRKNNRSIFRGE